MKAAPVLLLLLAVIATDVAAVRLRQQQTPDEVKLDEEYKLVDSFGNTALTPSCAKIQCGEYSCPEPFELKVDDTCCGYCWAEDHLIAVDRHKAVPYNKTGNVIEQCSDAPSTCKGPGVHPVRCFKPSCRAGDVAHCGGGSCCPICRGASGGGVQGSVPTFAPEAEELPAVRGVAVLPAAEPAAPAAEPAAPEPAAPEVTTTEAPAAAEVVETTVEIVTDTTTTAEPEPEKKEEKKVKEDSGSIKIRRAVINGVEKKWMSKDGGKTWEPMSFEQLAALVGPAQAMALLESS